MEGERQRSWWERNWKWFVPTGCLALVLLAAGLVAAIGATVFAAIRSSDAYVQGLEKARQDCEVQELLGAPVRGGWWVGGSVSVNGPSGDADLSIPLRGATGEGTLYVTATKAAGRWSFERLEAAIAGREERIDLTEDGRAVCE